MKRQNRMAPPRRKSRLERFLSLHRARRCRGAQKHAVKRTARQLKAMKTDIVDAGTPTLTWGSVKSLDLQLDNLRREFSGQPELLWHHAKLIVLIRRGFRISETYAQFRFLWDAEHVFLCGKLNVRWLISAADTFAEYDPNSCVRAVAMMAPLLANTVKMQESERYVCNTSASAPDPVRITRLGNGVVPLFSGMSCFTVGTDDTLRNMYWRLEPFFAVEPVGDILKTVWDQIQVEDTVFSRMRRLHRHDRTRWWNDTDQ